MFQPTVETDGGPWAKHDMPCAVCREQKAVLNLSIGVFQPCWECQERGWKLVYTNNKVQAKIVSLVTRHEV